MMMKIIYLLALVVCAQASTPSPSGSSFPSSVPSGAPSTSGNSELPSLEPTAFADEYVSGLQDDPTACPAVPDGGCSICGPGLCVTNPEAIFSFAGQPEVPCGALEDAGGTGQVPLSQCPFLPGLTFTLCGCASSLPVVPTAPTPAPVAPTLAPVEPTSVPVERTPAPVEPTSATIDFGQVPCPTVPDGGCAVCGDGLCVTTPDSIFIFAGQPEVACGVLEDAGETGEIPLNQCTFLHPLILDICGCQSSIPGTATQSPVANSSAPVDITPSPVTPSPVTPSPVTPSPVTNAPVPGTSAPVAPVVASIAVNPSSVVPVTSASPATVTAAPVSTTNSKKSMKMPKKSSKKVAMSMLSKKKKRSRRLKTQNLRGV